MMDDLFQGLDKKAKEKIKKENQPDWVSPMLATLTHDHFSDEEWIYERKLDGVRCLVFKSGSEIRIMSRNKKRLNETYPDLIEPLKNQKAGKYIVDGEIVTFEGDVTSFSRLQERINVGEASEDLIRRIAVYYYVFDIIHLEDHNLTKLPLTERKSILKDILDFGNKIRFTNHRNEEGEKFLEEACKKNWEGLIAKKKDSTYIKSRSKHWLKFKCDKRQEFVIGGFTEPKGERKGFGALLIGYYEEDKLKYAGKVGTGYDDKFLEEQRQRMDKIVRKSNPFMNEIDEKYAHWVRPEMVAEIGFTEWTDEGKLRHPRFIGLRKDKEAEDVVREEPG